MQVICTLKPTKQEVLPGEIARVELTRSTSADGFWLKTSSVLRGNRGLWDCFVAEPNKDGTATIRRRAIEIQHTDGDKVLVRGALSEGELVVSSAASRVVVGQKVRPRATRGSIMSVIQDRRLLVLTMAIITLAGVIAFLSLPRMEDPTISERAAMINTRLPGANVRRVDSLITEKLVDELRTFDEVKEIRSSSRASNSTIIVTLKDEIIDCDEVWARIRDKVSDTRALFPPDALAPEFEIIRIRAFSSIVALVWNSDRPPVESVLSRTASELETAIRNVPSTEKVELFGRPEEEIVLEVNQTELARVGLTVDELAAQIAASDAKQPAGTIRGITKSTFLKWPVNLIR